MKDNHVDRLRHSLLLTLALSLSVFGVQYEAVGQDAAADTTNKATNSDNWELAYEVAISEKNWEKAIESASLGIAEDDKDWNAYQVRGIAYFFAAKMEESATDFDRANELNPRLVPSNWQRGITLYYARRFEDGRAQFDEHRKVNPDDVENSAWHFLCNAELVGIEKAREEIFPSRGDSRFPMMDVLEMYRGKLTPEELLKQVEERQPAASSQSKQYAYLYVGLLFEAEKRQEEAADMIAKANDLGVESYMGLVGQVHAEVRKLEEDSQKSTKVEDSEK